MRVNNFFDITKMLITIITNRYTPKIEFIDIIKSYHGYLKVRNILDSYNYSIEFIDIIKSYHGYLKVRNILDNYNYSIFGYP